jgi:uncharacterized membrane protein
LAALIAATLGLFSLVATIWMKASSGTPMSGNPLLLVSAALLMLGLQLICLGLIGELLTRTYFESQAKPVYVVRNAVNFEAPVPISRIG